MSALVKLASGALEFFGFYGTKRRLLVIGPESSGKTSLIRALVHKGALPKGEIPPSTHPQYHDLTHGGFWAIATDLGAAGLLPKLWPSYYLAADAILFVVDATDTPVRLQEVRAMLRGVLTHELLRRIPIAIMGNKSELPGALNEHSLAEALGISATLSSATTVKGPAVPAAVCPHCNRPASLPSNPVRARSPETKRTASPEITRARSPESAISFPPLPPSVDTGAIRPVEPADVQTVQPIPASTLHDVPAKIQIEGSKQNIETLDEKKVAVGANENVLTAEKAIERKTEALPTIVLSNHRLFMCNGQKRIGTRDAFRWLATACQPPPGASVNARPSNSVPIKPNPTQPTGVRSSPVTCSSTIINIHDGPPVVEPNASAPSSIATRPLPSPPPSTIPQSTFDPA
jgi:ADP-ribosylation factor-like protein 8